MKWIGIFILLWSATAICADTGKYPQIVNISTVGGGHAEWFNDKNNHGEIKKNEALSGSAHMRTVGSCQVLIEIDANTMIILEPESQLEVPVILPGSADVPEIFLEAGSLRVQTHGPSQRYFSTPVSKDIYTDTDILLSYEPAKAFFSATVFSGRVDFRGINLEKSTALGDGTQASFRGVLEDGKVAFDVLLKGHRVVRGQLSEASVVNKKELAQLDVQTSLHKPPPVKPKPKPKPGPGQICQEPFAKLNECVWRCQTDHPRQKSCNTNQAKTRCLRQRCSADGLWTDDFVLPAGSGACQKDPVVGTCDY